MKPRTQEEIRAEIEALEGCKKYAPHRTIFGKDNHAAIDLQMKCLRGEIDTTVEDEFNDFSEDDQSAILEAQEWADGENKESPSSGWDNYRPQKA